MSRDEPVRRVGHTSADDAVAEERAVAPRQSPAREALGLGERLEQRCRGDIVEREDGEPLAAIEADDDTRRPAAEASARVVQENGSLDAHAMRYSEATSAVRYAAEGLPAGVKTPMIVISAAPAFSTM